MLAEHLQWLLSVRRPVAGDQILMPEEIAEQGDSAKDAGVSE